MTIGIGVPQYMWRLTGQSRRLSPCARRACPCAPSSSSSLSMQPSRSRPSSAPLLTATPVAELGGGHRVGRLLAGAADDPHDRQLVAGGEFEVTLVVGRATHQRAAAVVVDDIVGCPDREYARRTGG